MKIFPAVHGIHLSPFQFNVGGHSQLLLRGFKYCPLGHCTTHAVPFQNRPYPQLKQTFSGVKNEFGGHTLTQVPLKLIGYPGQSEH